MRGKTKVDVPEVVADVVAEGFAKVPDAEQYLKISRAAVYGLMEAGELPFAKFGRARRIPWRALREYASRMMVNARQTA